MPVDHRHFNIDDRNHRIPGYPGKQSGALSFIRNPVY